MFRAKLIVLAAACLMPATAILTTVTTRQKHRQRSCAPRMLFFGSDDDGMPSKDAKATARDAAQAEREAGKVAREALNRAVKCAKVTSAVRLATTEASSYKAALTARAAGAFEAATEAAEDSAAAAAYKAAASKEAKLAASAAAALSAMAANLANGKEIEEVLMLEMKTARKFLWRDRGLLHAFEHASPKQRKSLVRGTMDNFVAVEAAIVAAEAADATTPEILEEAKDVADELTKARSQMLQVQPFDR